MRISKARESFRNRLDEDIGQAGHVSHEREYPRTSSEGSKRVISVQFPLHKSNGLTLSSEMVSPSYGILFAAIIRTVYILSY